MTVRFEQLLRGSRHVVKIAQDLVSRDRLGAVRILKAMPADHIGRVACHNAKRGSRKKRICLPDISLQDPDSVSDPVEFHTPPRHVGAVRLDLQACQRPQVRFGRHEQRNDPRAGTQIQHIFARHGTSADPFLNKPGEKHRIHAKAESRRILNDPEAAALKVVDFLARMH